MKTFFKKLWKIALATILFFAGLFGIIFACGAFVILLSKMFTSLLELNEPGKVFLALILTAIILGIMYKPTRWLAQKWVSFINNI